MLKKVIQNLFDPLFSTLKDFTNVFKPPIEYPQLRQTQVKKSDTFIFILTSFLM